MARTITEIENDIYLEMANYDILLPLLTNKSKVSIWRLFTYIIAYTIYLFELAMDSHKTEVSNLILEQKSGTPQWYRNKALYFQYGFDLIEDSDQFNNENHTEEEIEESKIIKYAAVTEAITQSRLIVKIATEKEGKLTPIASEELDAFTYYLEKIRYAGVLVTVINYLPDQLRLYIAIKRDPLVLDTQGNARAPINGVLRPVENTINKFLKELPFNGELMVSKLTDQLQLTTGVIDIKINAAYSAWINPQTGEYSTPVIIDMSVIPESGYFTTEDSQGNNLIAIEYVV